MTSYLLRHWDSKEKIYEWAGMKKFIRSAADPTSQTDGFFKKFLFGSVIAAYKSDNAWMLNLDGNNVSLKDVESVGFGKKGPLVNLTIKVSGVERTYREFSPLEVLISRIDPTYDHVDNLNIFGYWLIDEFNKISSK